MTENRSSSMPFGRIFPTEFTRHIINMDIIIITEKNRNPFGDTRVNAIYYKSPYINTI